MITGFEVLVMIAFWVLHIALAWFWLLLKPHMPNLMGRADSSLCSVGTWNRLGWTFFATFWIGVGITIAMVQS